MYHEFFGLQKDPFRLTPDPEFLYLTTQHREALAGLIYALLARRGFVVLTANAGAGKTTLLARTLRCLPAGRMQTSMIVDPTLTPAEFLEAALIGFGAAAVPASKAQRLALLRTILESAQREGRIAALIVDEAHRLSPESIEEIRLLGNLESGNEQLLQIALVGQLQLDQMLNADDLMQFKQRISLRFTLEPLGESDAAPYIRHRWRQAGGTEAPFTAEAVAAVHEISHGIPRVMNTLCENSLMLAFGEGAAAVALRHVLVACRELQLAIPVPEGQSAGEREFAAAPPVDPLPYATLERHGTVPARATLLGRLTGKFRFARKTEAA